MRCSGLAKRARLVMSHTTGKIEVIGRTSSQVFLRYHRSADYDLKARFLVFKSNPDAMWFDDYAEVMEDYAITNPFRVHGPE
jgi:lysine 2,3-aminomutase